MVLRLRLTTETLLIRLGQSYQDYHCPVGEEHMECDVDPTMEITAVTTSKWYGAPGPL